MLLGECAEEGHLDALVLNQCSKWSLACLENVFLYALENKSKCLIQACIFVVERGFGGVASFSQHAQVKFLLESIRHIVDENCQVEFLHVMRYVKLLHSLCPPGRSEVSYINSILKIKQSCILYMLLSNNGASSICQVLKDFFPDDDILKSFSIAERPTRRFISVVKRQIHYFKNLVVRLLTDMEFRSSYFYDEWTEEFGDNFQASMKSDIEAYLHHVECCLLPDQNLKELFNSWLEMDSIRNPAMLYFLRLIMISHDDKLSEDDIVNFLMWLFPHPDFSLLDLKTSPTFDSNSICSSLPFRKVLSKGGWTLGSKKPWDFECLLSFAKCFLADDISADIIPDPCFADNNQENPALSEPKEEEVPQDKVCQTQRVPFQIIDCNVVIKEKLKTNPARKRKWVESQHDIKAKPKRPCLEANPESTGAVIVKNLLVNMRKNNACLDNNETPSKRGSKITFALQLSVDSPQCKDLLVSGSKFFSGGCRKYVSDETPNVAEVTIGCEELLFSTDSDTEGDSEKLMSNEDNSLIWIPVSYDGKPANRKNKKKPCRTLCFKSPSSEDHVSESEFEDLEHPPANISLAISADHQVIIPDLTAHDKNTVGTPPCFVKLRNLSSQITKKNGKLTLCACKISRQDDIRIILNEDRTLKTRKHRRKL